MSAPEVSVVVPYFERQDQLDRLLAALDQQTLPARDVEVVVADDGSAHSPRIGAHRFAVHVVRQCNEGFRLAQARNLGAAAARGRTLAFLDQDCTPGPDYLRLVHQHATSAWSLLVGHRLHADYSRTTRTSVHAWLAGDGPGPPLLPEPQWLLDGYARTDALTRPDEHAYQLVIGATLSLRRELFALLGGFDPSFRAYGGEDWELAHRAYVAGADLRWLSRAVVWHDGPDLAGRDSDLAATKNAETLVLARLVPDRDLRGSHLVWGTPRIVVEVDGAGASLEQLVAAAESLLARADAHLWFTNTSEQADVTTVLDDPRVHVGMPAPAALDRCGYVVQCEPVLLAGGTLHDLEPAAPLRVPGLAMTSTRDLNRGCRGLPLPQPSRSLPAGIFLRPVPQTLQLERHWQGRRLAAPTRLGPATTLRD